MFFEATYDLLVENCFVPRKWRSALYGGFANEMKYFRETIKTWMQEQDRGYNKRIRESRKLKYLPFYL